MYWTHANLVMLMHCTVPAGTQHGIQEPRCCACTESVQSLAMRMHRTVPAGTQHGFKEPQSCASIEGMQNWAMRIALYRARRSSAWLPGAGALCMY